MITHADIQKRVDEAIHAEDTDALEGLLCELYEESDSAPEPFDAAIQLKPEAAEALRSDLEGARAINWANRIARARRLIIYRRKTRRGFAGLRIVDEGDSWFQYPLLLQDTIDQLNEDDDLAIYSLSGAGDLVSDMAQRKEYVEALRETEAGILLLSGGGNDLLGGGRLKNVLRDYSPGMNAEDLIDAPRFDRSLAAVMRAYEAIVSDVEAGFPNVQIIGHAYDVPFPREGGGRIGVPLEERGIPLAIGRRVIGLLLGRFTDALQQLASESSAFHFVDLKDKVSRGVSSWFDELHPRNPGYGRAAAELRKAIDAIAKTSPGTHEAASNAIYEAANGVIILDPGHGGTPPPSEIDGSSWNNAVGPNGSLEKMVTLDVAKRAKSILETRGHSVQLTRNTDVNLGLRARAAVAKNAAAPVFVSIHFNAFRGGNAQGTETFVHRSSGSAASRSLCRAVQANMTAALGLRDRNAGHPGGVKRGSFGVINPVNHASNTAAVLHEVSFMDMADEEARLQSAAYRTKIATALADGIETHLGLSIGAASTPFEASGEEFGDAIEAAAYEAPMQAPSMPVLQARPIEPVHMGGHALPGDAPAQRGGFAQQIAESHRARLGQSLGSGSDMNDVNEFTGMDVGSGLILRGASGFERDMSGLEMAFENVSGVGFDLGAFEAFIDSLELTYFQPAEFLYLGGGNQSGNCAGKNALPPQHVWPNIAKTARMLDEIRRRLGASVRITSCYRSPSYNSCIGGASGSLHMKFNAIDWTCSAHSVSYWGEVARQVRSDMREFAGGIGANYSSFVHVDTRGWDVDF
ncbi:N-acetylmuramoyl-L-alanine amidase [uncultured Tateyamaria sp.]|uniref:N-acetylmuramoyl-L-alanine amidase n=1 Tax=uncultured Tateyamaria sp. TaxID=455651 RepID=UPI0026041171|nr:N-acetylmuramoyl-L-alanine amidase [uncultured Tateyamaria sp.]